MNLRCGDIYRNVVLVYFSTIISINTPVSEEDKMILALQVSDRLSHLSAASPLSCPWPLFVPGLTILLAVNHFCSLLVAIQSALWPLTLPHTGHMLVIATVIS